MDFSNFELWSIDKLVETIDVQEVKEFVKSEHDFWTSQSETKIAKDWLSWCKKQQNTVKIVEYDIPDFVKPNKTNICLYDIKVSEKKSRILCFNRNFCEIDCVENTGCPRSKFTERNWNN